jgi:nucleotide-binding universal stress UspA family protein
MLSLWAARWRHRARTPYALSAIEEAAEAPRSIFTPSVADPVGEVLMAAARAYHADMLVVGAYGHSRMCKSSSMLYPVSP